MGIPCPSFPQPPAIQNDWLLFRFQVPASHGVDEKDLMRLQRETFVFKMIPA